jgi:MFS family permease
MSSINGSLAKPFLNVYLLEEIESDPTIVILAYIPSGIIAMFLAPKLGKLVDKIHPAIGISVASVIGSLTTYFLISTTSLWIFAILLIFDTIIVNTAGLVIQNLLSRMAGLVIQNLLSRISLSHRGKVLGLNRFFSSFGYIVGPIFGGLAWDYLGFKAPFIFSIFIELCLIPFYIIAVFFIKPHLSEKYKKDVELHTEVI